VTFPSCCATNAPGANNVTFIAPLKRGECGPVERAASGIITRAGDPVLLAEAHLYHALAIGCAGDEADARKELEGVEAKQNLLSASSQQILRQIALQGIPRDATDVRAVLGTITVTVTTTPTVSTTTGSTTTAP
jgi:hypothetical protein